MDFASYIEREAPVIDLYLETFFEEQAGHPDIGRYLSDPLHAFNANGGKRHRPIICRLACELVGGDPDRALPAAAAIELFQTAALVHDDIADEGKLRRGKPCLHVTQGVGLAINSGDYAITLVSDAVIRSSRFEDSLKVRVLAELVNMMQTTVEGQALDIGWARDGRFDLTTEDYLAMARRKTACYSCAAPLAIGSIIGGASPEQVNALRAYGMACGLAFQIQDDLLNLVGIREAARKDFRNDITEGKRTLMAVYALEHSSDSKELVGLLSSGTTREDDLARAVEIMQGCGAMGFARDYAQSLVEEAKPGLTAVFTQASEPRELLLAMADFFIERLL